MPDACSSHALAVAHWAAHLPALWAVAAAQWDPANPDPNLLVACTATIAAWPSGGTAGSAAMLVTLPAFGLMMRDWTPVRRALGIAGPLGVAYAALVCAACPAPAGASLVALSAPLALWAVRAARSGRAAVCCRLALPVALSGVVAVRACRALGFLVRLSLK
jgi:hypothetical protein